MALNGSIRVATEELRTAGDAIRTETETIRQSLEEMHNIIRASAGYWEGEGGTICRSSFEEFQSSIQNVTQRLSEHVSDLYEMAGIYEEAEQTNQEIAEELSGDVII